MAQLDCSAITAGYVAEACGGAPTPGTTGRVVLMSYNDIDRGRSTVTGGVISGIILKSGKKGYEFDTLPNAVTGDSSVTQGTYINTVSHSLALRILAKNQNAKDFVNQMVNGLVVALVENKNHGDEGEVKWEVYGWNAGLSLSELSASTEMSDNVAYSMTLSTPSVGSEAMIPMSFYSTSEEETDEAVDALLSAAGE